MKYPVSHEIFSSPSSPPSVRSKSDRCWETSEDLYPRLTRGVSSTREPRNCRSEGARTPSSSEKNLDSWYLKAAAHVASQTKLNRSYSQIRVKEETAEQIEDDEAEDEEEESSNASLLIRETLLAVQMDYKSSAIAVRKGDVVTLLACKQFRDNSSVSTPRQWFYVRTRFGIESFIPAEVAGYGFL